MLRSRILTALLVISLLTTIQTSQAIPSAYPVLIRSIEFIGDTSFDRDTLIKELPLTQIGSVYNPNKLEFDIEMNLKGFLKEHGFMSSEAKWIPDIQPNGDIVVSIKIIEGPQYRLGALRFAGIAAFSLNQVTNLFDSREGDIANFPKIQKALEQLKHLYADRGYINWSYIPEINLDPSTKIMDLVFTIIEGRQFRTGLIGIVGCGSQDEENQVRMVIALKPGEIFRESDVQSSVAAINGMGTYGIMHEGDWIITSDEREGVATVTFWVRPQK